MTQNYTEEELEWRKVAAKLLPKGSKLSADVAMLLYAENDSEKLDFDEAKLRADITKGGEAARRMGKLNSRSLIVQPHRTVLVSYDGVPVWIKVYETAEKAQAFIDYETGTVTTLKPKANPRFEGSSSEPAAVWEEIPRNDDPHWSYEILPRTVTPIEADTAA